MSSKSVRSFCLAWIFVSAAMRSKLVLSDGVAARVVASQHTRASAWKARSEHVHGFGGRRLPVSLSWTDQGVGADLVQVWSTGTERDIPAGDHTARALDLGYPSLIVRVQYHRVRYGTWREPANTECQALGRVHSNG